MNFNFRNKAFYSHVTIPEDNFEVPEEIQSELKYFETFFTPDIFDKIANDFNQYSVQKTGISAQFTVGDTKDFIAIELLMGVIKLPAYTDYWSKTTRIPQVGDVMSLKKYQKVRKFLHFSDNTLTDDDRFYKIRPLLDKIKKNCNGVENERKQAVDEMMVPYKGTRAGNRKQYMPMKPRKWGMKMFVRAGSSGMIYDFVIYGGSDTFRQHQFSEHEESLGFGPKIVLALCQTIPDPPLTAVYFDNFFTTLELLCYLRDELGILGLGTIRKNRLRGLEIKGSTKKTKRGTSVEKTDTEKKLVVVKWADKKDVLLASSFVGKTPEGSVQPKHNKRIQCSYGGR